MSRSITKRVKPRVTYVAPPQHMAYTFQRHERAWKCSGMGVAAYAGTPLEAIKLYNKVLPHHIYKEFA